jgi:S-methylmethionine-dependent homocysteine/selenocysteine methylase
MDSRDRLAQLSEGRPFITDGGLETTLIFHEGFDLPCFAAFDLLRDERGTEAIRAYYGRYLALAREQRVGFLLDTATWRANPDWGERLGYSPRALDDANRRAVELAWELRAEHEAAGTRVVLNGCIGPRDDAYAPTGTMPADEARRYHARQIGTLADDGADMVTALTLTYPDEAIGIVRAAGEVGLPVAISFTVETDGRLPNGQALREAVERVEDATAPAPAYYMINCAHPTHFAHVLEEGGAWLDRVGGLRANASRKSHAELDEADELDEGDPVELGARHRELRERLPRANVVGGCCGTDQRHVAEVCRAWSG